MNYSPRHQLDPSWLKHAGSEKQIPIFWSWAAGVHGKHHLPGTSPPAPHGMGLALGYTAANNWVTLVKCTPHPINPSLECHSYPKNQRHLRNAEILFFSKKEKTASLILCSLHMLGERLKGPKEPCRMQAICHLAQKLSNFNSASGICCKCPCPVLHSDYFVEVAWKVLSSWLTALA